MRITALVAGIAVALIMILYGLSVSGDSAYSPEAQGGGSVVVLAGTLMAIGALVAFLRPGVAMWFFLAAGLISLVAVANDFGDAAVFSIVALALAVMSYRGKREIEAEQEARRKQDEREGRIDAWLERHADE